MAPPNIVPDRQNSLRGSEGKLVELESKCLNYCVYRILPFKTYPHILDASGSNIVLAQVDYAGVLTALQPFWLLLNYELHDHYQRERVLPGLAK